MDFDQLETFLEVARLSSFSRAAKTRFRTQPTISAQIRALEEEVGARLLNRSQGRKVSLTSPGKVFQSYAEAILQARRVMMDNVTSGERVPSGGIVVGIDETGCLAVVSNIIAEFKKHCARVAVSIITSERSRILEATINHSIDFAFVSTPIKDPRLNVISVSRDQWVIIVPRGHVLAGSASLPLSALERFPLVLPKSGPMRKAIDALFQQRQLKVDISVEVDTAEMVKTFVAADMGIGFMARCNLTDGSHSNALAPIPIADADMSDELALVFRKDNNLSKAALTVVNIAARPAVCGNQLVHRAANRECAVPIVQRDSRGRREELAVWTVSK